MTIPKTDTKAKEEITSKILISEKKSLWPDALDILETMMSKDIFNVALRGSKFVKVEEEVIFIRPANENAATWIEERVKAQVVNVSQYVLDPAINEVAIWAK